MRTTPSQIQTEPSQANNFLPALRCRPLYLEAVPQPRSCRRWGCPGWPSWLPGLPCSSRCWSLAPLQRRLSPQPQPLVHLFSARLSWRQTWRPSGTSTPETFYRRSCPFLFVHLFYPFLLRSGHRRMPWFHHRAASTPSCWVSTLKHCLPWLTGCQADAGYFNQGRAAADMVIAVAVLHTLFNFNLPNFKCQLKCHVSYYYFDVFNHANYQQTCQPTTQDASWLFFSPQLQVSGQVIRMTSVSVAGCLGRKINHQKKIQNT